MTDAPYDEFAEYLDDLCEEDPALDCGLTDEGLCMLAGTEHCDFDCPYRDSCK